MTKIIRCAAFLIVLSLGTILLACSNEPDLGEPNTGEPDLSDPDLGEPEYINANGGEFLYDGAFFYTTLEGLRYYDLSDIESGSYPVMTDALISGTEQIKVGGMHCGIDPWQTKKNGGQPVFVFASSYFDKALDEKAMRIMSYNSKTNTFTVIKDQLSYDFQDLNIYGDTVIYGCNEGKLGFNYYRIDIDGKNFKKMDNPKHRHYILSTVHDGRMYFYDEATQMVYSNSLDFDDEQYLFKKSVGDVYLYDGYIYYPEYKEETVQYNEKNYSINALLRSPLSDLSKVETVLENTYIVRYCKDKIYYTFVDGTLDPELYSSPVARIYEYSIETGEKREVFADKSGEDIYYSICGISDDHLVISEWPKALGGGYAFSHYLCIDLATGEETVLPVE